MDHLFALFLSTCSFTFKSKAMFLNMRTFIIALTVVNVTLVYGYNKQECDTMDIRNYKELDALNNCTVILGNLALVFPPVYENPEYSTEDINNRIFPLR